MCGEAPLKNTKNVRKFEEIAAFVLARSLTITLKYEVHSDFIYSLIVWIGNLNGIELENNALLRRKTYTLLNKCLA